MPDSPHIAYPLRLSKTGICTVEDATLDDIASRALFAIRTPLGWRPEAPDFGTSEPTFKIIPRIVPMLLSQIAASDQAIAASLQQNPTRLADGVVDLVLQIQSGT